MRIIWLAADAAPLPRPAAEIAVTSLADRCGVSIGDDDMVIVTDAPAVGGYALARANAPFQEPVWQTDLTSLEEALDAVGDARMHEAGIEIDEASLERRVRRLVRRRLPHWETERIDELVGILPRVVDMVLDDLERAEPAD